jgi:hypothetical protein
MNKTNTSDMLKIFTVVFITVLLFMFLLGAGIATAGVIRYVSANLSSFLPIMMNKSTATIPSSTGPLFVFSSLATTDGTAGGRSGMNDICASEDPDSHFCSLNEIEYAWMIKGVKFNSNFSGAWLDSQQLGTVIKHLATGQDTLSTWGRDYSCGGWTSTDSWGEFILDGGARLNWEGADGGIYIYCSEVHPVTCCK